MGQALGPFTGEFSSCRTHRGDVIDLFEPGVPSLLVFVPAAFTPVCGGELDELVALTEQSRDLGVRMLIVSCDTPATLRAWLDDVDRDHGLIGISDHWPHGQIARAFTAFDEALGTATRHSFAITAAGEVHKVAHSSPGQPRSAADHRRALFTAAGTAASTRPVA